MSDTKDVLAELDWQTSQSKLLAIVANLRGAEDAITYKAIRYLGFPLSISETFQQRNTNASIAEAINTVRAIQGICIASNKQLVIYISMGFGNPYSEPYSIETVNDFVKRLVDLGITTISIADTIGVSTPISINYLLPKLIEAYPSTEFGVHLHSSPSTANEKIEAAFLSNCKRCDGALKGWGGCPMANDELVGNLATEKIINYLRSKDVELNLNENELVKALLLADEIFPKH